ncbi:MAG: YchJ family protein [Gammaproteobacteria bacterium]|nr:YchJ family protein [Gammaproteobacteria bacterium]
MSSCLCGSGRDYAACCEPLLTGAQAADSAEALMRSRYSAYVKGEVAYVLDSTHPEKRPGYTESSIRDWALNTEWLGLTIHETQTAGDVAHVDFTCQYKENGVVKDHHENSEFRKQDGRWYFWDAEVAVHHEPVRVAAKPGRNDPCSCGSGKKYKKCCGANAA